MDDSFTRSLYIGRDKAQEVARRREAVEKELRARREQKIKEHTERISRAAIQKENELKEKMRQRQEKELQRQKAVLDRRCAQLEKDMVKKNEILQKAHKSASRSSQTQQKKNVYVFGSSTPRELSYLDVPKSYVKNDLSSSTERLSTLPSGNDGAVSYSRHSMARTPLRIIAPQLTTPRTRISTAASNLSAVMTRSVFNRLHSNTNIPPKPRSTLSSRNTSESSFGGNVTTAALGVVAAKRQTPSTKRTTPSLMTQSLYEPKSLKTATPQREIGKSTVTKASSPRSPSTSTTTKATPIQGAPSSRPLKTEASSAIASKKDKTETAASQLPPPIRPRKAVLLNIGQDKSNIVPENVVVNEPENEPFAAPEKVVLPSEQIFDGFDELKNVSGNIVNNSTIIQSSNNSSTGNLLVATKDEWDSGHESNSALDAEITTTLLDKEENEEFSLNSSTKGTEKPERLNNVTSNQTETNKVEENPTEVMPTATSSILPAVSATLEAAEKERESRRQKLNEILQRTRNANASNGSPASVPGQNGGDSASSDSTTMPTKFPLKKLSGIDASALAQDLLAQRRQKLQRSSVSASFGAVSGDNSISNEKAVPSLGNELANAGFFDTESPIISTTITAPNAALSPTDSLFRHNPLVQLPGEVITNNTQDLTTIRHEKEMIVLEPSKILLNGKDNGYNDAEGVAEVPPPQNTNFNRTDICIQEPTITTSKLTNVSN